MRPLPDEPMWRTFACRYKAQVDFRYAAYKGIFVPLWGRFTWRWRHPWCRWPVHCDANYHRRSYRL